MGQYAGGLITFTDQSNVDTNMGAITNVGIDPNIDVVSDDGGEIYDESLSLTGYAPVANFSTKTLDVLFGAIGLQGECVGPSPALVKQVDVIVRRLKTCKDALSGTPHIRYRNPLGLLRLNGLSMDRGGDAVASAILDMLTDGSNAPLAVTDGVALPTPRLTRQFTLGKALIAGVLFDDIDGADVSFNVTTTSKEPAMGDITPDEIGVLKVRPVLTLRSRDLTRIKAGLIELTGKAGTHLNCLLQLIRRKNSGIFEDFADPVHINITLNGLVVPDSILNASGQSRATNSIKMMTSFDGTNAPIVFDLAATYDSSP